uniref:Unannotated protein n=1 Tax=freshwater metagenome TaxID=449393 RepID=A0A6J5Z6D5_9ZZZZ
MRSCPDCDHMETATCITGRSVAVIAASPVIVAPSSATVSVPVIARPVTPIVAACPLTSKLLCAEDDNVKVAAGVDPPTVAPARFDRRRWPPASNVPLLAIVPAQAKPAALYAKDMGPVRTAFPVTMVSVPESVGTRLAARLSVAVASPTRIVSLTAWLAVFTAKVAVEPLTVAFGKTALLEMPVKLAATLSPLIRSAPVAAVRIAFEGEALSATVALMAERLATATALPAAQATLISKSPANRTPPAENQPEAVTAPAAPAVVSSAASWSALLVSENWKSIPAGSATAVRLRPAAP